jgi:hypothetical protein
MQFQVYSPYKSVGVTDDANRDIQVRRATATTEVAFMQVQEMHTALFPVVPKAIVLCQALRNQGTRKMLQSYNQIPPLALPSSNSNWSHSDILQSLSLNLHTPKPNSKTHLK